MSAMNDMGDNRQFNAELMQRIGMPEGAVCEFDRLQNRFIADPVYGERLQGLTDMLSENPVPDEAMFAGVDALSDDTGENRMTMTMLLFILGAFDLRERYHRLGIPEWIFYNSMVDLSCKAVECMTMRDVWGTMSRSWHTRFYLPDRFALGRFQYEPQTARADMYEGMGVNIKRGDLVINIHIPSCGPMTSASRMDSYRKAYEFYKNRFNGGIVPFVCHTWLLYPPHRDFLPGDMNILAFMDDFLFINREDKESFNDAWRVFGRAANKDLSEWPTDTRLRRAYVEHLKKGGATGIGHGLILFDGEKILK